MRPLVQEGTIASDSAAKTRSCLPRARTSSGFSQRTIAVEFQLPKQDLSIFPEDEINQRTIPGRRDSSAIEKQRPSL